MPPTADADWSPPRPETTITITVVIPFKNALPHLKACAESVAAAAEYHGATQLVFVDNGANDGSADVARLTVAQCGGAVLSAPVARVGELRNLGAAYSESDIVSFVDSDCAVPEDYFLQLEAALRKHPGTVVGSRYRLPPNPHWIEATWESMHYVPDGAEVKFINAGNFACMRRTFDQVGGFDPTLESGEDSELCARLKREGVRLREVSAIRAVHLGNPKSLRAFIAQQRWHGQGMFATSRFGGVDLPVVATSAYLGSVILAVLLALGFHTWGALTGFAVMQSVPVAAVVYRLRHKRVRVRWMQAVFLYNVYFIARSLALLDIVTALLHKTGPSAQGKLQH